MTLRLAWLGHPQVERNGQPVRFEMRKAVALLAYLSLERREHAREALAGLFWPDYDQQHALGNLRRTLSSLNKCLGPAWAESSRESLRLQPGLASWLDVDVFRQQLAEARSHDHTPADACASCTAKLEEAAALYQGDFLEGFSLPACPEFDDWQRFRRESLHQELGRVLELLADRLAAAGKVQPAIAHARRWVALDPLHEPAHRLLMLLYSRAGERGAALRQYETCRETLAAELGQEPEPATVALSEEIGQMPSSAEPEGPLVRTKLRLPLRGTGLVSRPRLEKLFMQGLSGPLTLITAPAGFGKTTLVASGVAGLSLPVSWLSLDNNDNRPRRFLNYLVAALQEVGRGIGSEAAQQLAAVRPVPAEVILTSLLNDLERTGNEIVLVLDDYQFIDSQAVHEQVAFLLAHCPQTFHLVVVTRSDPPLPLARLRARGQAVELRAADLSFTEPEAAQFLSDVMRLRLDSKSVALLQARTEGWIAGLQMAALSLRDRKDVAGFIQGFSGTHRYIMDYLLEEVLASQPPEIQRFLLYTSLLERLTAPLCDALLAAGDDPSGGESDAILAYLERANLFLVPLDDERVWYRYHHLFSDLLNAQLQRSLGGTAVAQLHLRAADWHGHNGLLPEAIRHASLAGDDERVERFIQLNYRELVSHGEQSWMRFWTGKLRKERVYSRPWLCIYEAYSHAWFGELDAAEQLLEEAETAMRLEMAAPDLRAMQGLLAYVKSRVTAMRGDIDQAIGYCLEACDAVPESDVALQMDTRITLGYEYFLAGDFGHARSILEEAIRAGTGAGAIIHTVAASCILARLHAIEGQLQRAYQTYQAAARLIPEVTGDHLGARALVAVGLADLFCEWNELDSALLHLKQGLDLLSWWGKADDLALAQLTLARICLAQAKKSEALAAVEKASQVIQTGGVFSEARLAAEVAQVRLWLAVHDALAARRWATRRSADPDFDERFEAELANISRARVLMALDSPDEAVALLSRQEASARVAARMGRVVEILLLKALALWKTGDLERCTQALTECLERAGPEGYVRLFLDEGDPLKSMLARWLAGAGPGAARDYAARLLSHFDGPSPGFSPEQEVLSPSGNLVEQLTERELEVLQLIALGMTNQAIARRLIVAPGTVKAHTASIYRKLDVANRTEAVARARQLGILP